MVSAGDTGNHDPDGFKTAIQNGVDQLFAAKGFQVLWAIHDDTDHRHAHLVVKAQSRFGKRLRLDMHGEEFDTMRQCFAEAFSRAGIAVQAHRREDFGALLTDIMEGRTFLRWPKRRGQGDLSKLAPNWVAKNRIEPKDSHQDQPKITQWWKKLFKQSAPKATPAQEITVLLQLSAWAKVFQAPQKAAVSWRELSVELQLIQPSSALADWYLLKRPEIFGPVNVHCRSDQEAMRYQAKSMPIDAQVAQPAADGDWLNTYLVHQMLRRKNRQRRAVMQSLWHLAGNCLVPDNPMSSRMVLSKALDSLRSAVRPIRDVKHTEIFQSIPVPDTLAQEAIVEESQSRRVPLVIGKAEVSISTEIPGLIKSRGRGIGD